jgi:hypothetical protein
MTVLQWSIFQWVTKSDIDDQNLLLATVHCFLGLSNCNFIVYFFLVGSWARHLQNPATKCDLPNG